MDPHVRFRECDPRGNKDGCASCGKKASIKRKSYHAYHGCVDEDVNSEVDKLHAGLPLGTRLKRRRVN
jgi:hypothetical protein